MLKCDGNYQNLYSVKQIYILSLKVQREFNNRFICNVGKERGTGFVQWRHRRVQTFPDLEYEASKQMISMRLRNIRPAFFFF